MVPFEKTITQNTNDRGALISETEQLNLVLMVLSGNIPDGSCVI